MGNELLSILEYIEQERGIARNNLIKALESAILTASRKSIHPASELRVEINPNNGNIQAWAKLEVVDGIPNSDQLTFVRAQERFPDIKVGDVVEWEVTPKNFGRIAAQTAKQTIIQQLRRAEKENVLEEFSDRIGTIISGIVRRFENGNIIIDFQKAEGIIRTKDKVAGEQYMPGERINAYLVTVDINTSGPSLIVSRNCPEFISQLFTREVTEIHDGIVSIMGIAREPGSRTKISVSSRDSRIDPVGACVGVRGIRVRNITNELDGERIDIVPYDEDIKKYAANALLPAKIQSVDVDEVKHELTIKVNAEQAKIAFGKKAQNVRLSSKLIGWNIKIVNEDEAAEETAKNSFQAKLKSAVDKLAKDLDVNRHTAKTLINNGYVTLDGVIAAGLDVLLDIKGIDQDQIIMAFNKLDIEDNPAPNEND